MGYYIELLEPVSKKVIEIDKPHFMRGSMYPIGGSKKLFLSITYNYSNFYYDVIDKDEGIRKIYGMTGLESIPILEQAISKLGDDISEDYWEATEGNAKKPLIQLLTMAKMRPDGIWDGD